MTDPTTELVKEFLEMHNYLVRKETKFYKNKEEKGTASDIDIIATRPNNIKISGVKLKRNIVAEVKNWEVMTTKRLDEIYDDKFKFIDKREISWKQLKRYVPNKRFDKILFCLATTKKVYDYALKKYGIKIITVGFIIKGVTEFFKKKERGWTYHPEWYNYNIIRTIMLYLYYSHKYKDKLKLEDLVFIDPEKEPRYRNRFIEINSKFLEDFIYYQTTGEIFINLLNELAEVDPGWVKRKLKSNKKFWKYLIKIKKG